MNAAHQIVTLGKASPGMILSDDILDRQGQVLLAHGTVLTVSTIAALARHDVTMLPVLLTAAAAPPADVCAVQGRIDRLFRHQDADDMAGAALKKCIEDYRFDREPAP